MKHGVKVFVLLVLSGVLGAQQFVPIHEIQMDRDSLNNSNYMGQTVTTTGIATTDFGMVASSRVFFLQEASGGPWSGIMVYVPSSVGNPTINIGDSIVVTGVVNEYYANTEIQVNSLSDLIVVSSGHPLPPLATVPCGYLDTTATSMYDPDSAEAYEHVLIQVQNAYVTNTSGPNGDWEITDGTGYVLVRNNGNYTYNPNLGDLVTVSGIVHTYYGLYRIQPRFDEDIIPQVFHVSMAYATSNTSLDVIFTRAIDATTGGDPANYQLTGGVNVTGAQVDPTDPTLVHLQTTTQTPGTQYTLYITNVQDTLGNSIGSDSTTFWGGITPISMIQSDTTDSGQSAWVGRRVSVSGICIVDSTSSNWYYLEEYPGGEWKGIQIYDLDHEPVRGDSVLLVGTVQEYFYMTEILNVLYFEVLSSNHPEPDPVVIQTGDLSAGYPTAEPYEGILVSVPRAAVVNSNPGGSYFEIDDGSGIARVANRSAYTYEPTDGDTIGVVGVVRFTMGNYQIEPRDDNDITIIFTDVAEGQHRTTPQLRLIDFRGIYRNTLRFGVQTTIANPVHLSLYDATGRQVFTKHWRPEDGQLHVALSLRGPHIQLAPGVYFLKLQQGDQKILRRFVLLQ